MTRFHPALLVAAVALVACTDDSPSDGASGVMPDGSVCVGKCDHVGAAPVATGYRMFSAYPHEEGSPSRCLRDRLFHRLMARLVTVPSPIWTGNFFAVLERRAD